MYICHIGPTSTLRVLERERFHMAIAPQVLEDHTYASFYRHTLGHVTLDVPTFEDQSGTPYPLEYLQEAIDSIAPHEVILPDVWGIPWKENVDIAREAASRLYSVSRRGSLGFMVVPHATCLTDYLTACDALMRIPRVSVIGIAERVEVHMNMPRTDVVYEVSRRYPQYPIHLLGCLRHMGDVLNPFVRSAARSMDTAKFVKWGLDRQSPTYGYLPPYNGRGDNYFAQGADEGQLGYIAQNIAYWGKFCEGEWSGEDSALGWTTLGRDPLDGR